MNWIVRISAKRLAEHLALVAVFYRRIDAGLPDTERLSGDADAAAVEGLHGDLEAFAQAPNRLALETRQLSKWSSSGVRAAYAELLLLCAYAEAWGIRARQ